DHRAGDAAAATSSALEYQQAVEHTAEDRIEGMLGAVVGRDKVIARVAATLDFSRSERTEETYDPDRSALKTQHATREETAGPKTAAGTQGTQSNLTNDTAAATGDGAKTERRDESQSYEVSKIVSRTVLPVGVLKQLSVAVMIDGTYTEEGGKRTFVPRPQPELDRLKELVKSAVGFSSDRGDKIEVSSVPFQPEPPPSGEGVLGAIGRWAPVVLVRLLAIGVAIGLLVWVVRPLLVGLAAVANRRAAEAGPMGGAIGQLTQENLALTQRNPERAAQLVREWLLENQSGSGE